MKSRIVSVTPHANSKSVCSAHGAAPGCAALIADVILSDRGSEHIEWAVCARWIRENADAAAWLEARPEGAALLDAS